MSVQLIQFLGAGTILEALEIDARVIVVPNTSLMDNHQLELAEELERQGYLLQGHLGYVENCELCFKYHFRLINSI